MVTLNTPKIRRELLRVLSQVSSLYRATYEPLMRWHRQLDPDRYRHITTHPHHPRQSKVAVLLVYQPQGLPASTWKTLEHLQHKGYSTLLVSNCALNVGDSTRASSLCWKTMVRSNFGYDFGGYQDAVLHLLQEETPVQQLLILNDSIWFPLYKDCDLLDRMEANPAGFVGAFQLEPTRNKDKMLGKKRPFMGSFFWHFKSHVLSSTAFKQFWRNYKASSSKYTTIRRGERRFTHDMWDAGIDGFGIYNRGAFDQWLKQKSGPQLKEALQDLVTADPVLAKQQAHLLLHSPFDPDWEIRAFELAMKITKSQNIMATAPVFMLKEAGLPFIKKSNDDANMLALSRMLRFIEQHPRRVHESVVQEIQAKLNERIRR